MTVVAAGGMIAAGASAISGCDNGMDDRPVVPGPSTPDLNPGNDNGSPPPPGGDDGGTGAPPTDGRVFDATGFPDTNQFPDAAVPQDGPIVVPVP